MPSIWPFQTPGKIKFLKNKVIRELFSTDIIFWSRYHDVLPSDEWRQNKTYKIKKQLGSFYNEAWFHATFLENGDRRLDLRGKNGGNRAQTDSVGRSMFKYLWWRLEWLLDRMHGHYYLISELSILFNCIMLSSSDSNSRMLDGLICNKKI